MEVLEQHTVFHDSASLVGEYGVHSEISRVCARLFDETAKIEPTVGTVESVPGEWAPTYSAASELNLTITGFRLSPSALGTQPPGMWLCGHFCAKAFAVMCDDLLKPETQGKNLLFWQTKSRTQPRGSEDEWTKMQTMPAVVQEWANTGTAESILRQGHVDLEHGGVSDYRGLTTPLDAAGEVSSRL
jgi:hypothetical protein